MSKKQSKKTREELCELYSEALGDFKKLFRAKKKALKAKNGKTQKNEQTE
jgi:hypothetical protein